MSTELNRGAVPAINDREQPSNDIRALNEVQTKGQQGRPVFT